MSYKSHIAILFLAIVCVSVPFDVSADFGQLVTDAFVNIFLGGGGQGTCTYNGDVRDSFKNCVPSQ